MKIWLALALVAAGAVAQTILDEDTLTAGTVSSSSVALFKIPSTQFSSSYGQNVEVVVLRQTPFTSRSSAIGICRTSSSACTPSSFASGTTSYTFYASANTNYTVGVAYKASGETISSMSFYVMWCNSACTSTCVSECSGLGVCDIVSKSCTCDSYVSFNSSEYCYEWPWESEFEDVAKSILLIILLSVLIPLGIIVVIVIIVIVVCVCGVCGIAAASRRKYPASAPAQPATPMTNVTVAAHPAQGAYPTQPQPYPAQPQPNPPQPMPYPTEPQPYPPQSMPYPPTDGAAPPPS